MIKLLDLFKESLKEETSILKEVGENTYSFSDPEIEVISPSKNFVIYTFKTKKKKDEDGKEIVGTETEYEVTFQSTYFKNSPDFKWETDISFDPISKEDDEDVMAYSFDKPEVGETNEFDAAAVLFTVAKIILAFIEEFKPESLSYSGIVSGKETPGASVMTKRDRIYDMMVQSMISKAPGYSFKRQGFNMTIFYKGELPVPGHNKIFDYPNS
jgi:hypothetical protein